MTSEGFGELFEGDSVDTCAGKFPLMSMGGRAEGLACADPEERTTIGMSGNFLYMVNYSQYAPGIIMRVSCNLATEVKTIGACVRVSALS